MMHKKFMELAITLANFTSGQTSPNPSVGAVLVKNNQIVGLGSHLFAGHCHAEINALNMAGSLAYGATLYVTLEPCVHFGKTPPCVTSIINAGITSVYVATLDLNPQVSGRGVQTLIDAGIDVEVGFLEIEAKQINQPFFHYIKHKIPYISIKSGVSLDGKLSTSSGESKWITNAKSREDAHYLRHTHDAILVGIETIIVDNPSLTTRLLGGGKNPIRIILDTKLRIPLDAIVITDQKVETWVIVGSCVSKEKIQGFSNFPLVTIIQLPNEILDLQQVLAKLSEMGIASILVEGGGTIQSSFLQQKLVNQIILYVSPMLIGGANAKTFFAGVGFSKLVDALKLSFESVDYIDDNLKIIAKVKES